MRVSKLGRIFVGLALCLALCVPGRSAAAQMAQDASGLDAAFRAVVSPQGGEDSAAKPSAEMPEQAEKKAMSREQAAPTGAGQTPDAVGSSDGIAGSQGVSPLTRSGGTSSESAADTSGTGDLFGGQPKPDVTPPPPGWGSYFQAIGVLLLVLGALYMGVWALKRFGKMQNFGRQARNGLTVESQFHLGPKKSLVVVRFLNKRLLLGVTDQQINLVTEMEADDPTSSTDTKPFRDELDAAHRTGSSSA